MRIAAILLLSSFSWGSQSVTFPGPGSPSAAPSVIAFVQASSGDVSGSTAKTNATVTTTGNLLVVALRWTGTSSCGSGVSVSDTAGDTFTFITFVPSTDCTQLYYAKNITGNAANVISSTPGSTTFAAISAQEFSGLSTTSPLDTTATGIATGTAVTSGAFTTSAANEVIVAGAQHSSIGGTWTAGAGYTLPSASITANKDIAGQYQVVSSIQTGVTASISVTASAVTHIIVATFK